LDNFQGTSSVGTQLLLTVEGSDGTATTTLDNKGLLTVHRIQVKNTITTSTNGIAGFKPGKIIFADGSSQITAYTGNNSKVTQGIIYYAETIKNLNNNTITYARSIDSSTYEVIKDVSIFVDAIMTVNAIINFTDTNLQNKKFAIRKQITALGQYQTSIYSETYSAGYGTTLTSELIIHTVHLTAVISLSTISNSSIMLCLDQLENYSGFEILSHTLSYTVTPYTDPAAPTDAAVPANPTP
jgi:hypothetical protein